MKSSIATVCISGDLREKLSAIAVAGFDGIEIFENDFLAFDGGPREVGDLVRDHGLEVLLFQPFRDFEGMPEPQRSQAMERAERKFDLMQEIGTDLVLVCSNVSPASLGGIDRAAADLRELGERAAKRGLRVGYEALAWGRHVSDHRDAWEIVRRADHPNVGIILDSFHTLSRRIDVRSITSIPADRIFFVQLADAPQIEMDLLYWSRHFRNMPGQGDLDVPSFAGAVLETGYSGPLSLEVFNDQFRGSSPRQVATDGFRSLVNLLDNIGAEEAKSDSLRPALPERIAVEGVEFVEFAVTEDGDSELISALRKLGFRRVGQHIRKQVDLWKQSGINVVVNRDPDSHAQSAQIVNGMSVADIGLRVRDAQLTVARATGLKVDAFSQAVGPGERRIPAIRGIGGSLIHFIDSSAELADVWAAEFAPVTDSDDPTIDCGLRTVDHIAQTMNYDQLLSWVLFYTSIFAAHKTPMLDVVDPDGLVRSQAIENSEGTFRITLNGAENQRTLAGRFVSDSVGSAAQHLAFRTDDIFGTVKTLRENGFRFLEISKNYYADLKARFGLDDATVNELSSNNIMYDRDGAGEYYQVYGPVHRNGFFFEIVQRRGGYAGYGAANAQFRIAAQKRQMLTVAA